jgi:hypothetical protein
MVCKWHSSILITDTNDVATVQVTVLLSYAGVSLLDSSPWFTVFAVLDRRFSIGNTLMFIDVLPFLISAFTPIGVV